MSRLLKKFFFKKQRYSYEEILNLKKKQIGLKIHRIFKGKVASGLYKNMKISYKENWGVDIGSKILGLYEEQIQKTIFKLTKEKKINTLVNFGAAEGFHLIGPVKKRMVSQGYGIEIDKETKKTLKKNINLNNLSKKIHIITFEDFKLLKSKDKNKNFSKLLFLIDIEGNEYDLINKNSIKYFKNNFLLIELHQFICKSPSKHKGFINLLKSQFKIKKISNSGRNPFLKKVEYLTDDERWMTVSEGRPSEMMWILCLPKTRI